MGVGDHDRGGAGVAGSLDRRQYLLGHEAPEALVLESGGPH